MTNRIALHPTGFWPLDCPHHDPSCQQGVGTRSRTAKGARYGAGALLSQRDWDRFIRARRSGRVGLSGKPASNTTIAADLAFLLTVLDWATRSRDEPISNVIALVLSIETWPVGAANTAVRSKREQDGQSDQSKDKVDRKWWKLCAVTPRYRSSLQRPWSAVSTSVSVPTRVCNCGISKTKSLISTVSDHCSARSRPLLPYVDVIGKDPTSLCPILTREAGEKVTDFGQHMGGHDNLTICVHCSGEDL